VLPPSFEFPLRGTAELYVPLAVSQAQVERRCMRDRPHAARSAKPPAR
jgi:hypothetical protein